MREVYVDLPVFFNAVVVPKGHQTEKTRRVLSIEPFSIPEKTDEEFPVVMRATFAKEFWDFKHVGSDRDVEMVTTIFRRAGDGQYLRPLCINNGGHSLWPEHVVPVQRVATITEEIAAAVARGENVRWPFGVQVAYGGDEVVPEDSLAVRKWVSDDRKQEMQKLQGYLDRCAVIDGVVYIPSEGPRLVLDWAFDGKNKEDRLYKTRLYVHPEPRLMDEREKSWSYAADNIAGAERMMTKLGREHARDGYRHVLEATIGQIEVVGALDLALDSTKEDMARYLTKNYPDLSSAVGRDFEHLTGDALRAFGDYRDVLMALDRAKGEERGTLVDQAVSALQRLSDAYEAMQDDYNPARYQLEELLVLAPHDAFRR
jgi:hypothetical protein